MEKLLKKHDGGKYSEPQLKLWAKLIRTGAHSDYDKPPNMPLITGEVAKSKRVQKQADIQGVIKDAAMVFASALRSPTLPLLLQRGLMLLTQANVDTTVYLQAYHLVLVRLYADPIIKI